MVSENSTATTVTDIDTNTDKNQSYGNVKHYKPKEVSALKTKFYGTGKHKCSLHGCEPGFVPATVKKFEELKQ